MSEPLTIEFIKKHELQYNYDSKGNVDPWDFINREDLDTYKRVTQTEFVYQHYKTKEYWAFIYEHDEDGYHREVTEPYQVKPVEKTIIVYEAV